MRDRLGRDIAVGQRCVVLRKSSREFVDAIVIRITKLGVRAEFEIKDGRGNIQRDNCVATAMNVIITEDIDLRHMKMNDKLQAVPIPGTRLDDDANLS